MIPGHRRRRDRTYRRRVGSTVHIEPFPVDVSDRGDRFVVAAALPGLDTEDLDVTVGTEVVRIVAEFDTVEEDATVHRFERNHGRATREIRLPEAIDSETASATYRDGVLEISLAKSVAATAVEERP